MDAVPADHDAEIDKAQNCPDYEQNVGFRLHCMERKKARNQKKQDEDRHQN